MSDAPLSCPHCQSALDERHIDRAREIATCEGCGRLVDVRPQLRPAQPKPPTEPLAKSEPTPSGGPGLALALIVPAAVVGVLALFFLIGQTTVKGQLRASGTLGEWQLAPRDCESGQREGFGGVVLKPKSRGGRQVRVVNDPVRGTLLVVVQPGRDNQIIEKSSCSRFDVKTLRTSTSINNIWAVDGHLNIDCAELRGSVTFEGCH